MIWKIARKELLSNLLTLRFAVGTVLFLALAVLFTYVLLSDYRQKLSDHDGLVSKNSDELRGLITYQNLKPTIYKPPEILAIFSKGVAESMGNSTRITIGEVPELTSAATAKNPLLSVFPVLDAVLIFKLVISVLAILLAYDAVSGEKEDGTLKLTLSNSVPRHQVLFGKFIGGMTTLAIPIAIGFLMTSLIMELSPTVELTGGDWIRIGLMFVISLIMVSALFNLGLFLSSLTKRSSDTLMLLLFLWVLFLLVIPNGSAYLSSRIRPIESREKIDSQVGEVRGRLQKEVRDFYKKNPWPQGHTIQSDASEPWGGYHKFATKNLIRYKQKLNAFAEPLKIRYADDAWQANRSYLESMKRQKRLAGFISRASPISLYEVLIGSLSRTDVHNSERFAKRAREYRQQMIDYLRGKKAFSSIRYFATVKEEHLFDVDNMDEYGPLRKKYGSEEPLPLSVSDAPRFRYRPEGVAVTMKRILPDMALLCFVSVLFFMCAFAAFLRYDVR
jgi:ABC-type transport system involved in multi-copper enzyme maturation permease subunit